MRILLFAAFALLAGCAGIAERVADQVQPVLDFALNDIRAAQDLAVAAGDEAAIQCYGVLEARVAKLGPRLEPPVIGAVSAYQKARNVRRFIAAGISEELRAACAWMIMDSRSFLRGLATLGILP